MSFTFLTLHSFQNIKHLQYRRFIYNKKLVRKI
nr:MAG TPA: hypothetical protein [Caudoviricetes sp.]